MKIAWLCNSAIGSSETFLGDNLELLQSIGEVRAYSGNPNFKGDARADVVHLQFDNRPQKLHHVLRRKFTGQDVRTLTKRKRCSHQVFKELGDFDPDLVWVEFGTTAHVASDLLHRLGKPYFIAVHGFDITREFRDPWYASEFVKLANSSAGVICASHHTQNLCRTAGVNKDRCLVVRLPLDGSRLKRTTPLPEGPVRYVHLGRLVQKKGPLQTLMAFHSVLQTHSDARLTFIGEGPLKGPLNDYVQAHKLGASVNLLGAMNQADALAELEQHHVFCQHSVTGMDGDQEGFALSPAEAALFEMPVVSTWHNGIPEHVEHGETGLLVKEWDIEGMAQAMIRLATDDQLRSKMGRAGRQRVMKLCDPQTRLDTLSQQLNSVIA